MKKCLYCNMEVENINKESICCECESKIALYKKRKKSLFKRVLDDLIDLFKHPKKLIPTIS